jgi:hypothetical protein
VCRKIRQILNTSLPVNISSAFHLNEIENYETKKQKAEKYTLSGALRSAACGGALRRCAAPSAAPPGRYATSPSCATFLETCWKKINAPIFFNEFRLGQLGG